MHELLAVLHVGASVDFIKCLALHDLSLGQLKDGSLRCRVGVGNVLRHGLCKRVLRLLLGLELREQVELLRLLMLNCELLLGWRGFSGHRLQHFFLNLRRRFLDGLVLLGFGSADNLWLAVMNKWRFMLFHDRCLSLHLLERNDVPKIYQRFVKTKNEIKISVRRATSHLLLYLLFIKRCMNAVFNRTRSQLSPLEDYKGLLFARPADFLLRLFSF